MTKITKPEPTKYTPETEYTPAHEYYYQHYRELSPHKRNIHQLHQKMTQLKKQAEQKGNKLPYKLPQELTLRKWSKEDKWEQRFYQELNQQYENIDYEALETTREFMKKDAIVDLNHYDILEAVQNQALQILQNINNANDVKIAQNWSQLSSQIMQVKKGLSSDYAETYSIVKFLRGQNNLTTEQANILREVGDMLGCDTKPDEEE